MDLFLVCREGFADPHERCQGHPVWAWADRSDRQEIREGNLNLWHRLLEPERAWQEEPSPCSAWHWVIFMPGAQPALQDTAG